MSSDAAYFMQLRNSENTNLNSESMFILGYLTSTYKDLLMPNVITCLKLLQDLKETGRMPTYVEKFFSRLITKNNHKVESYMSKFSNNFSIPELETYLPWEILDKFVRISKKYVEKIDEASPLNPVEEEKQIIREVENSDSLRRHICRICSGDVLPLDYQRLDTCNGDYDKNCIRRHIITEIDDRRYPIKCPDLKHNLCYSDIKNVVPEYLDEYERGSLMSVKESNPEIFTCCPNPGCDAIFDPNGQPLYNCLSCLKKYCLKCRIELQANHDCNYYQKMENPEDNLFIMTAQIHHFKQCPNCKFWVEKISGCNHMTCKCKFEFCYKCGGIYKSCNCTLNR